MASVEWLLFFSLQSAQGVRSRRHYRSCLSIEFPRPRRSRLANRECLGPSRTAFDRLTSMTLFISLQYLLYIQESSQQSLWQPMNWEDWILNYGSRLSVHSV